MGKRMPSYFFELITKIIFNVLIKYKLKNNIRELMQVKY